MVSWCRWRSPRRWFLFACLGLLLSGLISCQGNSPQSIEGRVSFWTMQLQPKFNQYFDDLIGTFERDNPPEQVSWVDIPWNAMESKILTAVSANTAPDVVNLNPTFSSLLASKNAWLNLEEEVSAEVKARYLPSIWQANSLGNGEVFGFPWYLTTRITIYNQDLLQQAGLSTPPATFAELAVAAREIKAKTGKYGFFVTFSPSDSAEALESLVQMGVRLVNDDGRAAFNSPAGKVAFQYWVDLYQQGLLPPEVLTEGHRRAGDLYQSGAIAFLSAGPELLASLEKNAPSIAKVSAAAPQIVGETGKRNVAVMNLVIPRSTKNPTGAIKFAEFVTNTDNQFAFIKEANVLPSTIGAVDKYRQELAQISNASSLENARRVALEQLPTAEVLIPPMANLNQLKRIIYENLGAAMVGNKTVDQALQDAEQVWNDNLKG
ncbi:ABC transporter substrate-binding protein [Synechocystis sp. CACIAM 05]|uniref:ABC transporter substrate-binding protein n=1 Tax=Synechocystis sp. CACIAM 05 TaxID=1933929 RepID=UPI00138E7F0D|nr:sugar ABC transporter substrate-binding protein [Synechocystis sp. CACIAM 05]QHU99387.1 ABC transporter substrate-binding protein [Synechocystis sp. CACIAM 05]